MASLEAERTALSVLVRVRVGVERGGLVRPRAMFGMCALSPVSDQPLWSYEQPLWTEIEYQSCRVAEQLQGRGAGGELRGGGIGAGHGGGAHEVTR